VGYVQAQMFVRGRKMGNEEAEGRVVSVAGSADIDRPG